VRRLLLFSLAVPVVVALLGCATAQAKQTGTTVNLVAFSTPKPVLQKLIGKWTATSAGKGVSFTQSYGPSGSQARAIVAGQPADIAFLSNALDVDTLAQNGLVVNNWPKKLPQGGIVADSVVAFVVRPGNPKHIKSWSDLLKPGVQVVTPDPFSSGGAKWNILAAYGAMRKTGLSDKKATAFVTNLFKHVVSQDSSASNAMNTFLAGKGDVLLTYESEAYAALAASKHIGLVIPKQTMLIQLPMVPLKSAPAAAKAFISYAHGPKAQAIFAENGYRPVVTAVLNKASLAQWKTRFAGGSRLIFRITDPIFGGWTKANSVWFDPSKGRMVRIEQQVGGLTH
jgi:sulfate/thiosulfate transport system substrate-binding protein